MNRAIDSLGRFKLTELDLSGQKRHKLTAIKRVRLRRCEEKAYRWYWECLCDCGNTAVIREFAFDKGKTQSCGCVNSTNKAIELPYGVSSHNAHYGHYKNSANQRDIIFDLTKEEFYLITIKNCYYCNALPVEKTFHKGSNGPAIANGIDRVDSDKGYLIDNCVPCCKECNMIKGTAPITEFLNKVKEIYENNKLGNT